MFDFACEVESVINAVQDYKCGAPFEFTLLYTGDMKRFNLLSGICSPESAAVSVPTISDRPLSHTLLPNKPLIRGFSGLTSFVMILVNINRCTKY